MMLLSGCGAAQVHQFLGKHAVTILSNPQSVEVYRVRANSTRGPTTARAGELTIGQYVIIAEAPRQDAAYGRELAAIFLSPSTYVFNAVKACKFQPDTLLRVHGPGGWVDLVTCFHCEQFQVASYDSSGDLVRPPACEEFVGVRDRLASLIEHATGVRPGESTPSRVAPSVPTHALPPLQPPPKRIREFIGEEAVAILSNPQFVEVWRVSDDSMYGGGGKPAPGEQRVDGYKIIARAANQDDRFAQELAAIFFSPDAYMFNAVKACMFQADTVMRVHGSGGWVDIVLCFHCHEFGLAAYDQNGNVIHGAGEDFDGVRNRLAPLVERGTGVKPFGE
jgi:hypothetical protein